MLATGVEPHSAKETQVQVTPLDRPLRPGEGRGEGLPTKSEPFTRSRDCYGLNESANVIGHVEQHSEGVRG
jgi:hypothetical protein